MGRFFCAEQQGQEGHFFRGFWSFFFSYLNTRFFFFFILLTFCLLRKSFLENLVFRILGCKRRILWILLGWWFVPLQDWQGSAQVLLLWTRGRSSIRPVCFSAILGRKKIFIWIQFWRENSMKLFLKNDVFFF